MRKMLFTIATLCACAVTLEASAQAVSVDRKQVSNAAARKMVDACLAFAEKNNILVGVAVVGLDGVLLDFHAMQGGGPTIRNGHPEGEDRGALAALDQIPGAGCHDAAQSGFGVDQ